MDHYQMIHYLLSVVDNNNHVYLNDVVFDLVGNLYYFESSNMIDYFSPNKVKVIFFDSYCVLLIWTLILIVVGNYYFYCYYIVLLIRTLILILIVVDNYYIIAADFGFVPNIYPVFFLIYFALFSSLLRLVLILYLDILFSYVLPLRIQSIHCFNNICVMDTILFVRII